MTESDVAGGLRDRVAYLGNGRARWRPWRFLADGPPQAPEGRIRNLYEHGVGAVLRVNVESIALVAEGKRVNALLALAVTVRARLLDEPDFRVLHETSLTWESRSRRLGEWVADDGGHLRQAIRDATQGLAQRIVEEVFLLFPPLDNRSSTTQRRRMQLWVNEELLGRYHFALESEPRR